MWNTIARFTSACTILVALCFSIQAASAVPEKVQFITLDEAITNSLESNPHLLAYGYQLNIKRGRVEQASLSPNPELLVTVEDALGTGEHQGFSNAETTVSLAWAFEHAVRERRINAAQASEKQLPIRWKATPTESLSAVDIEILRLDVAAETASRFLALIASQARAVNANKAAKEHRFRLLRWRYSRVWRR